jgi:hypothetical protein
MALNISQKDFNHRDFAIYIERDSAEGQIKKHSDQNGKERSGLLGPNL